ncbi:MAG: tetratricopeptide repeat protein [Nitrospirae bacterium]|nr:tetratricopeptide repeat protein [Nitrospirota bacterium]
METDTKGIFVGRKSEREDFHRLLRSSAGSDKHLTYHLYGSGGTGKTRLLEWMVSEVHLLNQTLKDAATADVDLAQLAGELKTNSIEQILVTAELIDFYQTGLHTIFGVLDEIVRQLGNNNFPRFSDKVESFDRSLEKEMDPSQRNERVEEVKRVFADEYRQLTETSIVVFLFDTFEAAGQVGEKLLGELLPTIGHRTVVVVVGRQKVQSLESASHTLDALQDLDAIGIVRQRGLSGRAITDKQIARANDLVDGRPIYINLIADFLNDGGTFDELLPQSPSEDFGRTLVRKILHLRSPEDAAILFLAMVWRLGHPSLLAHLLGKPIDEVTSLIQKLQRFSFIKYRAPNPEADFPGSCLLHDEMRDLVVQYCWLEYDRTGEQRRKLFNNAIEYYEERLQEKESIEAAQGERRASNREMRNYQVEWLYYQLQLDFEVGFKKLDGLFRDAARHRDLAFCQQLLDEIRRKEFWEHFTHEQRAEFYFRQGLVLARRGEYGEAENFWKRVVVPNPASRKYYATALQVWAEVYGEQRRISEGLKFVQRAEKAYQELLVEQPDNLTLKQELGETYNNWGWLLRLQGDLAGAQRYYERALDAYKGLPEQEVVKARARTLNNIGYIYQKKGDIAKAKSYCGRALHMRKDLVDTPYELGLSYITMGSVFEEEDFEKAKMFYEDALAIFGDPLAGGGDGLGWVLISLGRVHRRLNDFEQAIKLLKRAQDIYERRAERGTGDLAIVLNEIACVYRERYETESNDVEVAARLFQKSIEFAKASGNEILVADNLVNLGVMYARQSNKSESEKYLAEAKPLVDKYNVHYFRSWTYWAEGLLKWQEAETIEGQGNLEVARENYATALLIYVDAAAECVESIKDGNLGRRARRLYHHVLDEMERWLNLRPPSEVRSYIKQIKAKWATKKFGKEFKNDLAQVCDNALAVANLIG